MDSPLIYLTLCSWRNRVRMRLRRLREPRYLIGLVVGIAYFALVFGRPFSRRRRFANPGSGSGAPTGPLAALGASALVHFGAACVMFVFVALGWVWPSRRPPALAFTRADVQFLFTAPIPRWRLVRYKVLRSQLGALVSSAIVTFLLRPAGAAQGWMFFLGFGLVMAVLNLHITGISLTNGLEWRIGVKGLVRRVLPVALLLITLGIIGNDVTTHWDELTSATSANDVNAVMSRIMSSGLTGVVLWPFLALVRLPLADSTDAFVRALPWTLLALGLNYVWVLRIDVPFEEASAELAEKLARVRKEGFRALQKPRPVTATPFPLAAEGRIETAILWKNLISMGRSYSASFLLRFIPTFIVFVVIGLSLSLSRGGRTSTRWSETLTFLSMMVAAFVLLLGPQMSRADLRQDLPNLAVLRTWPLRGATLVRAEVLAPAVVLVSIAWLAMITGTVFWTFGALHRQIENPWSYLTAAMAVTPGIVLLQLLVQNALAVTFPAWVSVGAPKGGVDVMGQRMLMMFVSVLSLALGLLPAVLVAGVLAFGGRLLTGHLLIVLPGLAAALILLAEAFLATELIGSILDRTDVTALDPSDS